MLQFLNPAKPIDRIGEPEVIKSNYAYWRIRVFYSMFIGYAFFYFSRNSFSYAKPLLIEHLGFDKTALGFLGTMLFISYGLSKFVSGIISDRSNPRYFMSIGLIVTGILNLCIGVSSSFLFFAICLGLNGWFQGFGPLSCAKLLTRWYSQNERGSWWSSWSVSHNVGGAVIPLIVAYAAAAFGWRYAFYVPGVLCIGMGLLLMNRLRDTPESLGLPPVEEFRNDLAGSKKGDEKELSVKQVLFEHVLSSPAIWLLAIAYFFVYVVRIGMNGWAQLFLMETKGYMIETAGLALFTFEIGGFCGCLTAGWISDRLFGARRGPVNALFAMSILCSVLVLWSLPAGYPLLDFASLFAIGFSVFGPQMMVGLTAAELAPKRAAATANGFVGWIGYFGGAFAEGPLGKITQDWGWEGFFWVMAACALLSVLILLPLWSATQSREKSYA